MCLRGASGAGAALLGAVSDERLRAYYVWVPMLPGDTAEAAAAAERRLIEPRAVHYWDGGLHISRHVGQALGVDPAWDLYLAYGRDDTVLDRPRFWMHQLPIDQGTRLDVGVWKQKIQLLLDNAGRSGLTPDPRL